MVQYNRLLVQVKIPSISSHFTVPRQKMVASEIRQGVSDMTCLAKFIEDNLNSKVKTKGGMGFLGLKKLEVYDG